MSTTVQTQSEYLPGDYFSGGLSISGLGNGTDFTTMINQLKKIEMIPTQRLLRWKADWRERQDAFRMVRESLVELRDVCSKMSTMDKFLVKKTSSSMSSIATATANSSVIENSYSLEVKQVATTSIWSLNNEFYDAKTNINTSGASQKFTYEYAGTTRSLTVAPNTTLEQFKNLINNDAGNPGVRASLITSANGVTLQIKGMDQGAKNDLSILATGDLAGFPESAAYPPHSIMYKTDFGALTDVVNNSGSDQIFTYSYNGEQKNVTVPHNTTVEGFHKLVNGVDADGVIDDSNLPAGMKRVTAVVNPETLKVEITFAGEDDGVAVEVPKGKSGLFEGFGNPTTISGDPTGWHIQHSQNALIKVDGWPAGEDNWLEVSSNTVPDVVEGMTFTLLDTGKSVISVSTDSEAIQENVVTFIEAVNSFRKTIIELTKYDANKETLDLKYAESLYEMQKGGILTGNYGIQLLSSQLKQATAGTPKGFLPRTIVDDVYFGDLFTSLSQIGIKTNADGSGGDLFGMLELNTDPKLPMLDDVLKKNPEAVAEFFAAVNKGVSDSSHFSFASSMQNITRPGAYNVSYDIDENGMVVNGVINGKEAKWDAETNQLGLVRQDPEIEGDDSILAAKTDGAANWTAEVEVIRLAANSHATMTADVASGTDAYVTGSGKFYYTVGGKEYSVNVAAGESIGVICAKINYSVGNPGVTASWEQVDGKVQMRLESRTPGGDGPHVAIIANATGNSDKCTTVTDPVLDNAIIANGQDAIIKVNGTEERHKTNDAASTTVPGATFNLKKAVPGTTVKVTGIAHNDADGLYIQIDNLTRDQSYTGQLRIKQGKIPEILELLNGTPSKPEEGMLGSKGSIQVLLDNYDKIVEGIDKKISKETDRLTRWERTQKLRFARLEETLKQYENLQKTIESQVKQLGGNSK